MNNISPPKSDALADQNKSRLSRQRPTALYQQVKNYIIERIRTGEWPPETRVPSENTLIKQMGASKMTVNRALRPSVLNTVFDEDDAPLAAWTTALSAEAAGTD